MWSLDEASPDDLCRAVAQRARAARLAANLTQAALATRSGVALGSLKRFEATGQGSLELVARLALALRHETDFRTLFAERKPEFRSIDEVMAEPKRRQRARGG